MTAHLDLVLLLVLLLALMAGYPVGLTLGGISVLFAGMGWMLGTFDFALFFALPSRLFGIMSNSVLLSVPMFVFMGLILERSRLAENMLDTAAQLFSRFRGGLTISVTLVGALLAASTGIVGASVVTLGLLALPSLIRNGVSPPLAGGTVAAAGTLGQIIPPSIVLIVLADQMSNAWQQMQVRSGEFSPNTISIAELFAGAVVPGLLIVAFFVFYQMAVAGKPEEEVGRVSQPTKSLSELMIAFLPPLLLIVAVLGSILAGVATASEAASVGAVGALLLSRNGLGKGASRPCCRKALI